MCGTFTQIAGMALGLYGVDLLIKPVVMGRGEGMAMFMFLIKGMVEFYVYRWFKCDSSGKFARHALQNLSLLQIFLGGVIGGVTLMFAGNLVGEKDTKDFLNVMVKYSIEAVILNFVYGATDNMLTHAASNYGSSGSSVSG